METDEAPALDAEQLWIAKYRRALEAANAAASEEMRIAHIREAVTRGFRVAISKVAGFLAKSVVLSQRLGFFRLTRGLQRWKPFFCPGRISTSLWIKRPPDKLSRLPEA